jgi:hypothetical protein
MISKNLAEMEIRRLSGLDFFPRVQDAVNELVAAIREADDELQAHKAITEFTQSESQCPKPADIARVLHSLRQREKKASWLEGKSCPHCSGSGFRMETKIMRAMPGMAPARYDFAVKCNHQRVDLQPDANRLLEP